LRIMTRLVLGFAGMVLTLAMVCVIIALAT
jgi:hypothetical protein